MRFIWVHALVSVLYLSNVLLWRSVIFYLAYISTSFLGVGWQGGSSYHKFTHFLVWLDFSLVFLVSQGEWSDTLDIFSLNYQTCAICKISIRVHSIPESPVGALFCTSCIGDFQGVWCIRKVPHSTALSLLVCFLFWPWVLPEII